MSFDDEHFVDLDNDNPRGFTVRASLFFKFNYVVNILRMKLDRL